MATYGTEAGDLMALLGVDDNRLALALGLRTGSRIRILHGSTSSTAAPAPRPTSDRRRSERLTPDQTRWAEAARLRPGFDVKVLDIGPRGVLIEAPTRLHIGSHAELTLFATDAATRLDLLGTVRRCQVSSLNPITYRGALEFQQPIDVQALLQPFLESSALSA